MRGGGGGLCKAVGRAGEMTEIFELLEFETLTTGIRIEACLYKYCI